MREARVSRTSVRQALTQLRGEGLVATRLPFGTFVLGLTGPVVLEPGDSVTAGGALTITRAHGATERYPAGTPVVAAP
jgi:hypothetical protein